MTAEKPRAVIFIAEGFEEIEAITVIDILRRAKINILSVSIAGKREVAGSHGVRLLADMELDEAGEVIAAAEILIFPGGPGTEKLKNHKGLVEIIEKARQEETLLAAICAAPSVLGKYGVLEGKEAVCYPGYEKELTGARAAHGGVAVSGNVITGKAAGAAHDFAFKIVEILLDKSGKDGGKAAEEIRKLMFYL